VNLEQKSIDSQALEGKVDESDLQSFRQEEMFAPGHIQPHGMLLVLAEPDLTIIQTSCNTEFFLDIAPESLIHRPLSDLFPNTQIEKLRKIIANNEFELINLIKFCLKKDRAYQSFDGIVHRNPDGLLILELEPRSGNYMINFLDFYYAIRTTAYRLRQAQSLQVMCQLLVDEIHKLTGFDRVMTYQFIDGWQGTVVAETKRVDLSSYLGLHFPGSDVQPCLPLYYRDSLRIRPDIGAEPVALFPPQASTSQPLDLSLAMLRGIGPCYQEFMANMGVKANIVISLFKEQRLWGMITCHHYTPMQIPYEIRQACDFLGQAMSTEIFAKDTTRDYDYRLKLQSIQNKLSEYISRSSNFVNGLINNQPNILDLVNAKGAVICWDNNCSFVGDTPLEDDLTQLLEWLDSSVDSDIFYTNFLSQVYPPAISFRHIASGLLTISLSSSNRIVWFRPEQVQTVTWAGDPTPIKTNDALGQSRLLPRRSFDPWPETIRFKSSPWLECERDAALQLRSALTNIVLRKADELALLTQELERSNTELEKFAYIASHDLQEPLNLVCSYVQLLEMRYREQLDQDAMEFINFAVEGVNHMQGLIDDLLAYSRVGSRGQEFEPIKVEVALSRACTNLQGRIEESGARITHNSLPLVMADEIQLTQLFQNLIGNAIKFRQAHTPEIHVGVEPQEHFWQFSVHDNGIGIDPQFAERIFLIFQRLHTRDEYEGTGIGLAICKKIIERHGGRIWMESLPGEGSTFFFTLLRRLEK
jgi:chemotaxis family two-component system sensor kinase Cph1